MCSEMKGVAAENAIIIDPKLDPTIIGGAR